MVSKPVESVTAIYEHDVIGEPEWFINLIQQERFIFVIDALKVSQLKILSNPFISDLFSKYPALKDAMLNKFIVGIDSATPVRFVIQSDFIKNPEMFLKQARENVLFVVMTEPDVKLVSSILFIIASNKTSRALMEYNPEIRERMRNSPPKTTH